ncbi:MAG: hypothetical protein Q7T87_10880, partial [Polaromonas sp.]|nr:hypothetical protein [Polaromonas sp.]
MIISPPFLPQGHATEEAFLTASMCGVSDGFYPLTTSLQWHNGVHLQAPMHENQYLDVRAIADGEVVHVVTPDTAPSADATHPQNHPAYGAGPEWTDKGMLILRHTTEIGAQEDTPTVVTFFSVYLHLQSLAALTVPKVSGKKGETEKRPLRVGDRIYRKDVLGRAGQIYGQRGRIHFEVCSDETNLQRLLGSRRPLSWQSDIAPPTTDGRTDALFGSTCVYLPATAPVRTGQPTSHLQAPAGQGAGNTDILGIPLWVDIRYSLGDSTITTFYATDHPEQGVRAGARIGELSAKGAEYAMFTEAQSRHAGAVRESSALMPATGPALSSPSGWYGLLRWARKLGPDPLPPNAAHWRQIATPQGPRWADLNTAGSFKFSDADFPIFKGWQCINDDERHDDQRCDSPRLRTMLLTGIETSQRA